MNALARLSPRITSAFLLGLAATGCTTTYDFEFDAVRSDLGSEAPFANRLGSAHPAHQPGDLKFDRVAAAVRTALSSKGMSAAAMDALTGGTGGPRRVVLTDRDRRVLFVGDGVSFEQAGPPRPLLVQTAQQ